jgi:pimeloyl-ACP methyl ester carboxylesterase
MSSGETIVQANGLDICVETHGDPADEPMLLIMGLASQLVHWPLPLVEALVDRGFYVIRFDNRDVGRSSKVPWKGDGDFISAYLAAVQGEPVEVPYLLTDMAADAAGVLDAIEVESAHVVGASMGGMIAQMLAIEHPHRVRTLTSIMSTTGEGDVGQPSPEVLGTVLAPVPTNRADAIDAAVATRKAIASPDHYDEDHTRQVAELAYDRCWDPAGTARQLLAIAASGSRADALARLQVPTLVIHGDLDPLVAPSGGRRTAELVPGAELVLLEGMGHDLPPAYLGPIVEAITRLAARVSQP